MKRGISIARVTAFAFLWTHETEAADLMYLIIIIGCACPLSVLDKNETMNEFHQRNSLKSTRKNFYCLFYLRVLISLRGFKKQQWKSSFSYVVNHIENVIRHMAMLIERAVEIHSRITVSPRNSECLSWGCGQNFTLDLHHASESPRDQFTYFQYCLWSKIHH